MQYRISKFENFLLIFTLLDILFAPYAFFLATTYSQFVVLFWFVLKDKRNFNIKEVRYYYGIIFFILISSIISLFTTPENQSQFYFIENIKRGMNIGMGISYYFFFNYMFRFSEVNFKKWVFIFILYVTLWAIVYYIDMNAFLQLKATFNKYDAVMSNLERIGFLYRFSFIWTDPNNVGYAIIGIVTYIILDRSSDNKTIIVSVFGLLFSLILVMSMGSLIVAAVMLPLAIFIRFGRMKNFFRFVIMLFSTYLIIYIIYQVSDIILDTEIGQIATLRLDSKFQQGDSRPIIWKKLIENKNIFLYLFFGEGVSIFVDGKVHSPHNGHLVFIYGFGLISYFLYMYIIFRVKNIKGWLLYLPILPFFICFSVNIGIGELKYAAIMYMFIAKIRSDAQKNLNVKLSINQ